MFSMKKLSLIILSIIINVTMFSGCKKEVPDGSTVEGASKIVDKVMGNEDESDEVAKLTEKLHFKSMANAKIEHNGTTIAIGEVLGNKLNNILELVDSNKVDFYNREGLEDNTYITKLSSTEISKLDYVRVQNPDYLLKRGTNEEVKPAKINECYLDGFTVLDKSIKLPNGVKLGDTRESVVKEWGLPGDYQIGITANVIKDYKNDEILPYHIQNDEGIFDVKAFFEENKLYKVLFQVRQDFRYTKK